MRLAGRQRLGFYPLPLAEATRIRGFLQFSEKSCAALDPCIGEGAAFAKITEGAQVHRYGIELDANRAEQARSVADEVIHGNCFDVQCPVESFSLVYLMIVREEGIAFNALLRHTDIYVTTAEISKQVFETLSSRS